MHTKYKNLLSVNALAKHWAITLQRPLNEFVDFYCQKNNYENLLSVKEIKSEAAKVYARIKKVNYTDYDPSQAHFRIKVTITSRGFWKSKEFYDLWIFASTLEKAQWLAWEMCADYVESGFMMSEIMIWRHLDDGTWGSLSAESEKDIRSFFDGFLGIATPAYLKEEQRLRNLTRQCELTHRLHEIYDSRFGLIGTFLSYAFIFASITYVRGSEGYETTLIILSIFFLLNQAPLQIRKFRYHRLIRSLGK